MWFRNRIRNTLKFYPFIIPVQIETLVTFSNHSLVFTQWTSVMASDSKKKKRRSTVCFEPKRTSKEPPGRPLLSVHGEFGKFY